MKYYAVIDTNVLVSAALKWHSVSGSIVELVFEGYVIPVLNQVIIDEYKTVLSRLKFHLTNDIVEEIINSFNAVGIYVDATSLDIDFTDPKDKAFYEVVMEERKKEESYWVTGNVWHFPVQPFIVTPRQMLDLILHNIDE
ncbi:MAG: putative toxin-antitoxin system toxin component, PIN family [Acidaminococcaceae bacterium]|nr:putative toxin-antitoxin system toxin component, PIN family [Acidaminococcaceae bacterium]